MFDQRCIACSLYIDRGGMCDPCHETKCESVCRDCETYLCWNVRPNAQGENAQEVCGKWDCFDCEKDFWNNCEDYIEARGWGK